MLAFTKLIYGIIWPMIHLTLLIFLTYKIVVYSENLAESSSGLNGMLHSLMQCLESNSCSWLFGFIFLIF